MEDSNVEYVSLFLEIARLNQLVKKKNVTLAEKYSFFFPSKRKIKLAQHQKVCRKMKYIDKLLGSCFKSIFLVLILSHICCASISIKSGRICKSPDQTFYHNQCLPIGNTQHCPRRSLMKLYDGPNNIGYCGCSDETGKNNLRPIFSHRTHMCHFQNTRGPCKRGEWFVLKTFPQCERIPKGCPADGRHVYGKLNAEMSSDRSLAHLRNTRRSRCWKIGSYDADCHGQLVGVKQNAVGDLQIYCSPHSKIHDSTKCEIPKEMQTLVAHVKEMWKELSSGRSGYVDIPLLITSLARLLFLSKDRYCESPDETFYQGQCLPIGSSNHCPPNSLMELYDGSDNQGFCDCQETLLVSEEVIPRPIYSEKTGMCHTQYTQGPCRDGEWFVLNNSTAKCEQVPRGCPNDGKHVFWSPNPSMAKKCWELGSPCHYGIVRLEQGLGDSEITCIPPASGANVQVNLAYHRPLLCRAGTRRFHHDDCRRGQVFVG